MTSLLLYGAIVLAAAAGFGISLYITRKKNAPSPLVCPMGLDCSTVIHSDFGHFFGVPVELIGVAYYSLTLLVYGSFILLPSLTTSVLPVILFPLTLTAFLFSAYLTFIQAVTLRHYCTWCLGSATLSTIIFLISLISLPWALILPAVAALQPAIIGFHLLGLAIGLGGATVADFFFFKFLRDLRISHFEANMLKHVSQVIWGGLGILVVSGAGLFLANPTELMASDKFMVKLIVVGVIIINGAFLNLYITPKLVHISFGDPHRHHKGELRMERRIAFALGAISVSSWYSAFVLGLLPFSPLPFWQLLGVYAAIVFVAVSGSQIVEKIIARRGWAAVD